MKRHFEICPMDFLKTEIARRISSECGVCCVSPDDEDKLLSHYLYDLVSSDALDVNCAVDFDVENISIKGYDDSHTGLVGFNTMPNGLNYLGVVTGGDWETPVFLMLYWDGTKIKMYIPASGNTYNVMTNMAYGNDEEADKKDRNDRGFYDTDEMVLDSGLITEEVMQNFTIGPVADTDHAIQLMREIMDTHLKLISMYQDLEKQLLDIGKLRTK